MPVLSWLADAVRSAFGAPLYTVLPLAAIFIAAAGAVVARPAVKHLTGGAGNALARGFLMALLAVTGLLAVENYRATDYYRYGSYLNAYEFYHYYLGSKYAREVGYTRLYAATLIADEETGLKWSHSSKTIRDLSTGGYVNAETVLRDRDTVKAHFTPERWEEFKKDVQWFKDPKRLIASRWNTVIRDKGYNGTPVWSMVAGGILANSIPTSSPAGMMFLALLDPLLILLAMAAVVWAFGPRAALYLVILLGTHYMMKWWHMKGAFLRTDWAMCAVISVCLMKKKHHGAAGALLAWSVLSRIFPAVLLFGPGVKLLAQSLDFQAGESRPLRQKLDARFTGGRRRFFLAGLAVLAFLSAAAVLRLLNEAVIPWLASPDHALSLLLLPPGGGALQLLGHAWGLLTVAALGAVAAVSTVRGWWTGRMDRRWLRFFAGFAVAAGLLLGASAFHWRGTGLWQEYATKIGDHNRGISEWRVGYKYVFMAEWPANMSFTAKAPKEWTPRLNPASYNQNQTAWWSVQLLVLGAALLGAWFLRDHRAYVLGFAPLFFLASPTYYYHIMLLIPMLFFVERPESPPHLLGAAMMLLSGMSGYAFYGLWRQQYGTYYWLSVEVMVIALYMLVLALSEGLARLTERREKAAQAVSP